jgi:heme A synthase
MRVAGNICAAVVLAIGLLWTLQGAGIIGDSPISGQTTWSYIGIAAVLVALALLAWVNLGRANRRQRRPDQ